MAAKESEQPPTDAIEAQTSRNSGGWITFPFIAASMLGSGLAVNGGMSNFIVYLIKEFNVKSIDAAQISNIVNGCTSLAPVAGAIISDAYFGCYPVVAFSTFISFLSLLLLTLTATVPSLRPPPCPPGSHACESASAGQLAVLYLAVALLAVGTGGTRFNTVTMGADQFDKAGDKDVFFNWYFVILYTSSIIGATVIVYIQDSVSWGLGFGLGSVAGFASLAVLLAGSGYYRRPKVRGSAFTGLARVVVAAVKKRKISMVAAESLDYYYGVGDSGRVKTLAQAPSGSIRFLNRAAVISTGDTNSLDGSVAKPWSLTTVEQVEDLKALLRIFPLWTSSIFLSVSIGIQLSLTVLQALTMDRKLGPRFSVPAGSIFVASLASVALFLPLLDRLLVPLCQALLSWTPTPLQRIGAGHVLNSLGMAASALVERGRAGIVRDHHAEGLTDWVVPMSALWLVVPLAATGVGEALHFPGQVSLYYQEFPKSLRSTATGMVALLVAIGFYLSTAVIDLVRRLTHWLPDNLNGSRLENVYWMLAVVSLINLVYYVVCARMYKYQTGVSTEKAENDSN